METWNSVGLLVLGWLFGLLSPVITRTIEQKRNTTLIQQGIAAELSELGGRLATASNLITGRFGRYTREHVKWMTSVMEQVGDRADDELFLKHLKTQTELEDA